MSHAKAQEQLNNGKATLNEDTSKLEAGPAASRSDGLLLTAIDGRKDRLLRSLGQKEWASRISFVLAAIFTLTGIAIFISARTFDRMCFPFFIFGQNCIPDGRNFLIGGVSVSIIFAGVGASQRRQATRQEIEDLDNEADLLRISSQSHEQKAQKLLKIQQTELKRFYDQTLQQSSMIFAVGVGAMVLGFIIIIATLYFVGHDFLTSNTGAQDGGLLGEKVVVAVLGAAGGILTNFVGAMYIKMFSEIVQSVARSQNVVVATYHLHLANLFAASIGNEEKRQTILAELATALRRSMPAD